MTIPDSKNLNHKIIFASTRVGMSRLTTLENIENISLGNESRITETEDLPEITIPQDNDPK